VSGRRTVAVIGAGGFLGSHLVPALCDASDLWIEAVDVDFRKLELESPRVRRHRARIDEPGLLAAIVEKADTVLALNALCTPALYNTNPLEVIDASFTDLVPVVKACAEQGKRLVHFSTCEVYGRVSLDETGRPAPSMNEDSSGLFLGPASRERWSYACAKQLLERVVWAYGTHGGLDFTIVRPFNVIGPRMDYLPGVDGEGVPRVLPCFMNALLRGQDLLLVDGGKNRRSFLSVGEFVDAVLRIVLNPSACRNEIVNLGNPHNDVSIREFAETLAAVFAERAHAAKPARFRSVTAEAFYGPGYDDTEQRVPDIGKARRLLGWEPRETLEDMLPGIVDDYVERYGSLLLGEARAG
jgi:UDP-apiose/xylose synthase